MNRQFVLIKTAISVSMLWISCAQTVQAADQGTTIIGSKEAPTVLNIVPWRSEELSLSEWPREAALPLRIASPTFELIEPEELTRELDYFNKLQSQGTASGQ